jgi:carbamoyl-phosphate synthase large subunit
VFISTNERDKEAVVPIARSLIELGFELIATAGTRAVLMSHGLEVEAVFKLHEGRPNVVDIIKNQQIGLIINTPSGEEAQADGKLIRRTALTYKIPIVTTIAGAKATAAGIRALQSQPLGVKAIQDYTRK